MASTTFVDGETLIEAAWLNDVNAVVYTPGISTAADIANVPAGSITATNVQAALNELDSEKQPLDNELTALATSTAAANKIPYYTGTTTAGELDWNSATTLANSATTISSNTVVKSYVDAQVLTCVADVDFTGTNQSVTANGYQKLPGGLIIQWGTVSIGANANVAITWPLAFPTAVFSVSVSTQTSASFTSAFLYQCHVVSPTTAGCSFDHPDAGTVTINWMAIGH